MDSISLQCGKVNIQHVADSLFLQCEKLKIHSVHPTLLQVCVYQMLIARRINLWDTGVGARGEVKSHLLTKTQP